MRPTSPRRGSSGRLTFRVSLTALIPLLVLLTGAVLTLQGAAAARDAADRLAAGVFEAVTDRARQSVLARLSAADPASETLAALVCSGGIDPDDPADLAAGLLPFLDANPGFTWVSWSNPRGDLLGVYRRGGSTRLWITRLEVEGGAAADHAEIADFRAPVRGARQFGLRPDADPRDPRSWALESHRPDSGYDARLRPFFGAATEAGGRAWTRPYAFFDPVAPGVTCATPVFTADLRPRLRGVLTVDFALADLSTRLAELAPAEGARVILHTPKTPEAPALALGHPALAVVAEATGQAPAELLGLEDLPDPVLRAYLGRPAGVAGTPTRFDAPAVPGAEPGRWLGETGALFLPGATRAGGVDWRVTVLAPASAFLADAEAATRRAWAASVAALLAAVLLSLLFAELLTRPLRRVSAAMERVGRFEVGGPAGPRSVFREIDAMGHTLDGLRGSLRSFARYVPEAVVRRQLASGVAAEPGGEARPLSVMFSDVVGFTSVAESTDPAELLPVLGDYFERLVRGVDATGGTVDKFIGDALMAFWNAPADDPDHAAHAVAAALAGQRALAAVADDAAAPPLLRALARTRFGVATGTAVVGNVGTPDRLNYTVLGDTVNLAARLESLNKAYGTGILVDAATATAAPDAAVYCPVDVVAVKGKRRGVGVFEPLHDTPGNRALADATTDALAAYAAGGFPAALAGFRAVLRLRPERVAASVLLTRCEALVADPPEAWDGVHRPTSK